MLLLGVKIAFLCSKDIPLSMPGPPYQFSTIQVTSVAFAKSLVYAWQPFIADAYQINHCISQKPTLKCPLVDFKQGCEWWVL